MPIAPLFFLATWELRVMHQKKKRMSAIIARYRIGSISRNNTTTINARLRIVCNIMQNTPRRFFFERLEVLSAFLFIRSAPGALLRFFDIGLIPFIYSMYT